MTLLHRRNFLLGLGAVFAAPAIVKAEGLMKVKPTRLLTPAEIVNEALDRLMEQSGPILPQQTTYIMYYTGSDIVFAALPDSQSVIAPGPNLWPSTWKMNFPEPEQN